MGRNRDSPIAQVAQSPDEPGTELQLAEALYRLLAASDLGRGELELRLSALAVEHGDVVYAELIFILSHLRFHPDEAKAHWAAIIDHRSWLEQRVGRPVEVRVALVSYFFDVVRKFKNPKVIEMQLFEQTQASAYRDELTGLCNFRLFKEHLEHEICRGERFRTALSLVMIDVDEFKAYNDHNGHEAGNEALATIGSLIASGLRKVDVAARYGGEEFALILPSTGKADALKVADRARVTIENEAFPFQRDQPGGNLTVSMGIATYPVDARDGPALIRCADRAMYAAKDRGKNQVQPHRDDRRSYRRIDAALDGEVCVLSAEMNAVRTVNVSEGGLLFHVDRHLPIGSLIKLNLNLSGVASEIETTGRVVRLKDRGNGRYEAAIRIVELSSEDRRALARFIEQADRK